MLMRYINKPFAWPSILGSASTLPHFWMGRNREVQQQLYAQYAVDDLESESEFLQSMQTLSLPPLRMVASEMGTAILAADMRYIEFFIFILFYNNYFLQVVAFDCLFIWKSACPIKSFLWDFTTGATFLSSLYST